MGRLTMQRLHELLSYDSETGVFTWRVSRGRLAGHGDVAGSIDTHGYRHITVDSHVYLAHRLAFMYVGENIPEFVDHINGDRRDNRRCNLRSATKQQNKFNSICTSKLNLTGVSEKELKCGIRYQASFRAKGYSGKRYLGLFTTKEEAHLAYLSAATDHYGAEFVSKSSPALTL